MQPDNLDEQLLQTRDLLREYQPARCVIDSVTPVAKAMGEGDYVDYMRRWNSSLAADGATVLLTAPSEATRPVTEMEISTFADNVISLRDVEIEGTLKRSLAIFKARGIAHDRNIWEFDITPKGVMMKKKLSGTQPIMGSAERRPLAREEAHPAVEHGNIR